MEEVKQKMAETLKGIKINKSKTVLSSGKNVLIGVLHKMESTLKVMEDYTCKNKYTIFMNKFYFGGFPPNSINY